MHAKPPSPRVLTQCSSRWLDDPERYAKNMKSLVTIICSFILPASSQADEIFDKNKGILDKALYEQATAVVRVWIKSDEGGSKYHWVKTLNHATPKAPKGKKISPELKVAYKSFG